MGETVNFLAIQEESTGEIASDNPFSLVSVSQKWLDQMPQSLQIIQGTIPPNLDISQLLPVQNPAHSPQMNTEWLNYTQRLVGTIDRSQLARALEKRTKDLSPNLHKIVRKSAITAQKSKNPDIQLLGFEPVIS